MEKFFAANNIPSFLGNLLELMGVSSVQDLLSIDDSFIGDLEKNIQEDAFSSYITFDSKQKRIQYFGFDLASTKNFRLRPLDRMKLLGLKGIAQAEIDKIDITFMAASQ